MHPRRGMVDGVAAAALQSQSDDSIRATDANTPNSGVVVQREQVPPVTDRHAVAHQQAVLVDDFLSSSFFRDHDESDVDGCTLAVAAGTTADLETTDAATTVDLGNGEGATTTTDLFNDRVGFHKHVKGLHDEQKQFVYAFLEWHRRSENRVLIVTGGPGTGKTHAVLRTLEFLNNLHVLNMAPTGRIAQRNGGRTIHSALRLDWGEFSVYGRLEREELLPSYAADERIEKSRCLFHEFDYRGGGKIPNVVFVDEVSMIDDYLLYWIVQYLFALGTKRGVPVLVVLAGDKNQLAPVKSFYNVFGSLDVFEKAFGPIQVIRLTKSMRFDPEFERVVSLLREVVQQSDEEALVEFLKREFPVVQEVDESLLEKCRRALVYRNETVEAYNRYYLSRLPGKRVRMYALAEDGSVDCNRYVDVKNNCDVYLTKNNNLLANGTPLVFLRYDAYRDELVCKMPDTQRTVRVERDFFTGQFPVVVGFAGTIHKFQGDTVDELDVLFNFDGCRNRNLIYTALSRVRSLQQILAVVL